MIKNGTRLQSQVCDTQIIVVKAAGSQEGTMRRAVETFDDNARAVFAFCAHGW